MEPPIGEVVTSTVEHPQISWRMYFHLFHSTSIRTKRRAEEVVLGAIIDVGPASWERRLLTSHPWLTL